MTSETSLSEFDPHYIRENINTAKEKARAILSSLSDWLEGTEELEPESEVKPKQPIEESDTTKWKDVRYIIATFSCAAMTTVFMLQINANVALFHMVNNGTKQLLHFKTADGFIEWDYVVSSFLRSSYYLTYMLFQIPGALIAKKFGPKWTMFGGLIVTVLGVLFTPLAWSVHTWGLVAAILVQGAGGAVSWPCMHILLSKWTPKPEQFFMYNVVYSGVPLGIAAGWFMTGVLLEYLDWQYVFYIEGAVCCPLLVCWIVFVYDKPKRYKRVMQAEREYIRYSWYDEDTTEVIDLAVKSISIQKMLKSSAFWGLMVPQICFNICWCFILLDLPLFLHTYHKYSFVQKYFISALPFVAMFALNLLVGKAWDVLQSKEKMSPNQMRKLANMISSNLPGLCFAIMAMLSGNLYLILILSFVIVASQGFLFCGIHTNHLDLTKQHCGLLVAITNTFAILISLFLPQVIRECLNLIARNDELFKYLCFVIAVICFIQVSVYSWLGTTEQQNWYKPSNNKPKPVQTKRVTITEL